MGLLLMALIVIPSTPQDRTDQLRKSTVAVSATDGFGTLLPKVTVDSFVDEYGDDQVDLFRNGTTASGVPFGHYRIALHSDSGYRATTFEVEVLSLKVLITAGLEWYGVENTKITGQLRGKLTAFPPTWHDWWCKASGLYSRFEFESAVTSSDWSFDFGEVPPGIYILACVAEKKFIAVRTVRIAADAAPLTIRYKSHEDGEFATH